MSIFIKTVESTWKAHALRREPTEQNELKFTINCSEAMLCAILAALPELSLSNLHTMSMNA
jgi:hypothetical protein